MGRRGIGYSVALTIVVVVVGAMHAFENENADGRGLHDYASALWWTAMITTFGSEYWPQALDGRVLCRLLALYAFAVLGYAAATLSAFFKGDAASDEAKLAGAQSIRELRQQVAALRAERSFLERSQGTSDGQ